MRSKGPTLSVFHMHPLSKIASVFRLRAQGLNSKAVHRPGQPETKALVAKSLLGLASRLLDRACTHHPTSSSCNRPRNISGELAHA